MEQSLKILLIAAAAAVASLLVAIGIIHLFRKRPAGKNLIMGLFFGLLALLGCGPGRGSAHAGEAGDQADADQDDGKDDPERIKKLNNTEGWKVFRSLWRQLDALEPGSKVDENIFRPYLYSGDGFYEKAGRISDSLTLILDRVEPELYGLTKQDLLDSAEVQILTGVVRLRLEYMFSGFHSMVTRMMPPPGQVEKEACISNLEERIDLLMNLRKKGKIDDEEAALAMESVFLELKTWGLLDVLGPVIRYDYFGDPFRIREATDTADRFALAVDAFEKDRAEFMRRYKPENADETERATFEAYERGRREIAEFQAMLPRFRELVNDLLAHE